METRQNERIDQNEIPNVVVVETPSKVTGAPMPSDTKHTTARQHGPVGGPESLPNVTKQTPGFDSQVLPNVTQAKHTTGFSGGAGASQETVLPGPNGLGGPEQ